MSYLTVQLTRLSLSITYITIVNEDETSYIETNSSLMLVVTYKDDDFIDIHRSNKKFQF